MKRMIIIVCALVGWMALGASEYKESFYRLLDTDLAQADSLLRVWERNDPDNPEIYPARFNFYLRGAMKSGITDPVESIQEQIVWDDSLVNKALEIIDQGISLYPDRLDFRFGRATVCGMTDDWEGVTDTGISIIDRARDNKCRWLWSDNEVLQPDSASAVMLDGLHDYERQLAVAGQSQQLLDTNLKYYPSDPIALTLKSALTYEAGEQKEAISLMELAYLAAPDDPLIADNLAYMYFAANDDRAASLCRAVIDNPDATDEQRAHAQEILRLMSGETLEMRLYDFEFIMLPALASGVQPGQDGVDLLSTTDYVLGPRLRRAGYHITLDPKDIKVDVIGQGDGAIVVWTMPDPPEVPLSKYIAFVPDTDQNCYRVYELEKSFNLDFIGQVWVLGIAMPGAHSNFGDVPYPATPEEFVRLIKERALKSPQANTVF